MDKRLLFCFVLVLLVGGVNGGVKGNFDDISKINNELFKLSSEHLSIYDKALGFIGRGKSAEISKAIEDKIIGRKEIMLGLAEERPDLFLTYSVSEDQKNNLFKKYRNNLEQEATKSGTLLVIEDPHS